MICVYPADCTDFSTNGNGTLAPLSAEVTETLNGEYELTLVHPIDEAGKWQRLVEGCILRAPVPAAMTPRVNFTAPGDDNRTEVWRVNTDFSGAETRKGTLRLRSGPGTKYKVLATYKNGSFVQVIAKTNSSWYEVTAPDGKHGYMSTTYLVLDHTEGSASEATSSVVESRQLRDQPFRIYRIVPELDKITVYTRTCCAPSTPGGRCGSTRVNGTRCGWMWSRSRIPRRAIIHCVSPSPTRMEWNWRGRRSHLSCWRPSFPARH